MTVMDEREKPTETRLLLCAYGIAEFTTALEHLGALRHMGLHVPDLVFNRIYRERQHLAMQWWRATHGDPTWQADRMDIVVTEARAWVTDHQAELDDYIESRRNQEST